MRKETPLSLIQGTLDVLILRALAAGPVHGYGICAWIRDRTAGDLGVEDAALYQALRRLEARRWLDAEWGLTDTNRRARFYRLTPKGRRALHTHTETWHRYVAAISKVLDPA
jgi:PadR family transcriptional regulator, regulatory protein PadR